MGYHTDVRRGVLRTGSPPAIFLTLALASATFSLFGSESISSGTLPDGNWGGRGAELRVLEQFAEVEFDCALGRIDAPIQLEPSGEFRAAGTYLREPGGPGRIGDPEPTGVSAVYSGFKKNSEIRLSVLLVDTGRTIGPYVLHQSQESQLEKCL